VADETIYRCINEACGRPTPRPVNFCPWCGTAQAHAGARGQAGAVPNAAPSTASSATAAAAAAATAAAAGASAAAALSGWSDAPPDVAPDVAPAAPSAAAPAKPAAPPSATGFGRSGKEPAGQASAVQAQVRQEVPRQEVPRPPLAARPSGRSPIRLRWWLVALALLWGVWLLAKPSSKKIDRQIDAAIALARECKASDAQAELIALRKSRASQEQLQRLQQALNDEAAACTRRRQRGKAWNEANAAVESALAAASWDKARSRLQAFTKRWGEDDDTRAMKNRIEAARREDIAHREHPLAVPSGAVGSSGGGATGSGGGKAGQDGRF
jgi:hypothetical protein